MRETGCGEMLTVADFPDSKGELLDLFTNWNENMEGIELRI